MPDVYLVASLSLEEIMMEPSLRRESLEWLTEPYIQWARSAIAGVSGSTLPIQSVRRYKESIFISTNPKPLYGAPPSSSGPIKCQGKKLHLPLKSGMLKVVVFLKGWDLKETFFWLLRCSGESSFRSLYSTFPCSNRSVIRVPVTLKATTFTARFFLKLCNLLRGTLVPIPPWSMEWGRICKKCISRVGFVWIKLT